MVSLSSVSTRFRRGPFRESWSYSMWGWTPSCPTSDPPWASTVALSALLVSKLAFCLASKSKVSSTKEWNLNWERSLEPSVQSDAFNHLVNIDVKAGQQLMILCLRRKSFVSKWFAILLDNSKAAPIRCIASRRTVPDIKNSNYWRSLRPDNNGKMTPSMLQLPCHNLAIDIVMGSAGIKADKGRQSLFRFSFSHLWRWVGKKSLIAYHGHGFPWPREILCKRDIHRVNCCNKELFRTFWDIFWSEKPCHPPASKLCRSRRSPARPSPWKILLRKIPWRRTAGSPARLEWTTVESGKLGKHIFGQNHEKPPFLVDHFGCTVNICTFSWRISA